MDRHDHEIVLRLSERAADWRGNADDLILVGLGAECLANRIHIGIQLCRNVGADERHSRAMLVVRFGDHSALCDADIANVRIIRRGAHHVGAFKPLVP